MAVEDTDEMFMRNMNRDIKVFRAIQERNRGASCEHFRDAYNSAIEAEEDINSVDEDDFVSPPRKSKKANDTSHSWPPKKGCVLDSN